MSLRGDDWKKFSTKVEEHIDNYTIPQYGDKGVDLACDYTVEECMIQIKRYNNRQGKNSRPGQDKLDLLKMAHYAQMAYTILEEQENA